MKVVVKNRMMFSYPYFKPPYYHRYSRYGYYYPNVPYNSNIRNGNMHTEQPNKKPYEDTIHTKKVQKPKTKQEYSSVTSYGYSHKRCPYNGLFLYTKKRGTFF